MTDRFGSGVSQLSPIILCGMGDVLVEVGLDMEDFILSIYEEPDDDDEANDLFSR